VDRPVAGGRDDPTRWARWQALRGPPPDGLGERLLDRVLGDIDVAEDADQYRDRTAVLRPEDVGDLGRRGGTHEGQSSEGRSSDWNGRTSTGNVVISASRLPHARAASRS